MKKTLAFINGTLSEARIGNNKYVKVQIDGRWCWKTEEQLRKMGIEVKFRSARQ